MSAFWLPSIMTDTFFYKVYIFLAMDEMSFSLKSLDYLGDFASLNSFPSRMSFSRSLIRSAGLNCELSMVLLALVLDFFRT